ncbi:MAG: septation protein A [Rhizobiaceae bacterium]|jgi:intracellular septation protein|nr:septation protein A [Rhizobiaceae bacterium]
MTDQPAQGGPADGAKPALNPILKLALELGPLIVFFFANARGEQIAASFPALGALGGPIFIATALFMAATAISLSVSYAIARTVPVMPLVSGVVVFVFGALTLWLHNDTFIKMKPTIVNTLFGAALLIGLWFGRSFLKLVFDSAIRMDEAGWRTLTIRWGLFFFFLAILNEVVWRGFSTDFWVAFKVWAVMPITLIFTFSQIPLMMRHSLDKDEAKG